MPLTSVQWQKALASDQLRSVYLLAGEELLVLEAADALRVQARRLGYAEREVFDVSSHFDWHELARAAASGSLFASRRLIELRLAGGRPGRDGAAAMIEYCLNPPPEVVLLISTVEWSNKHGGEWSKKIDAQGCMVVFNAPRPAEWHRWISARLGLRGLTATADAVALLAERVEGNLLAAAQEIDKLAVLHDRGPIDAVQMESLVADSARFDVFKLSDAAFAGEAARALRILAGLREEGEELVAMLGWLVNQLQLALRLANAADFTAQIRAERLWPAREQLFRKALQRAPREHWVRCLRQAALIDRMLKGRELGDPWQAVARLIAALAEPRTARVLNG